MEITQSARGFRQSDVLVGSYGDEIELGESSIAFDPHIWMWIKSPVDANEGSLKAMGATTELPSGTTDVSVHLSAHQAWELRNRLDQMLANHFYGDVRPEVGDYWDSHKVDEFGRQADEYYGEDD
jgi:hypothetical protein